MICANGDRSGGDPFYERNVRDGMKSMIRKRYDGKFARCGG